MKKKNKIKDCQLKAMIDFVHSYKIGVQLGNDNSYTPSYSRKAWARGYMTILLSYRELHNGIKINNFVARNLAHELGHFLIAPLGRRFKKDYGIPPNEPDWTRLDEMKAKLIEEYLLRYFGFARRIKLLKDPLWAYKKYPGAYKDHYRQAWKWFRSKEGLVKIKQELESKTKKKVG
jgi:hypothetical protein